MQERLHLEGKHLIGKDGNGKGCQRRHGENKEAFDRGYAQINWKDEQPQPADK